MLADRKKGNSIKTLIDLFLFLPVAAASHFYAQSIKNVVFRTEAPTTAALAGPSVAADTPYVLFIDTAIAADQD